jgi:hypothetical protein
VTMGQGESSSRRACREADGRKARGEPPRCVDPSLPRGPPDYIPRRDGAAPTTVEALMLGLRDGIEALPTNPDRLRRLSELNAEQLRLVCERLQRFKPNFAPVWSSEEVQALVDIWGRIHAGR